jgi:hypothetical protein
MASLAIDALKSDWERHARDAREGDPRASYAAQETLERLECLGVDQAWLSHAKQTAPELRASWAINEDWEE